jgi:hypothetical protein
MVNELPQDELFGKIRVQFLIETILGQNLLILRPNSRLPEFPAPEIRGVVKKWFLNLRLSLYMYLNK